MKNSIQTFKEETRDLTIWFKTNSMEEGSRLSLCDSQLVGPSAGGKLSNKVLWGGWQDWKQLATLQLNPRIEGKINNDILLIR